MEFQPIRKLAIKNLTNTCLFSNNLNIDQNLAGRDEINTQNIYVNNHTKANKYCIELFVYKRKIF